MPYVADVRFIIEEPFPKPKSPDLLQFKASLNLRDVLRFIEISPFISVPGKCCPVCVDTDSSCVSENGGNHKAGSVWKIGKQYFERGYTCNLKTSFQPSCQSIKKEVRVVDISTKLRYKIKSTVKMTDETLFLVEATVQNRDTEKL